MHDLTIETIPVGDRDRIRVVIDDDEHECPIEWDAENTGMLTIRRPSNSNSYELGVESEAAHRALILADQYDTETRHGGEPYYAALRHLRRQGFVAEYYSLTGYSQSDWMDVLIWAREPDHLYALAAVVEQWFRGDIYTLVHERLVEYVRTDNRDADEPDLTDWDEVDSVGSCYLDPDDHAAVLVDARNHFTLPVPA